MLVSKVATMRGEKKDKKMMIFIGSNNFKGAAGIGIVLDDDIYIHTSYFFQLIYWYYILK